MGTHKDFYNTKAWIEKRKHILRRDKWLDQYLLINKGIKREANIVHHILPREDYPEYQFKDWNLISVNEATHKRLHEKYTGRLSNEGERLARITAVQQGIKLTTVTLVCGLPGTGKSTWTREHLGAGICYELDAIASAFRLTVPHSGEPHAGARRMAAALRKGWFAQAKNYASRIFIIRTAPDITELSEIMPDKIVICTKQYVMRPYEFDIKDYRAQVQGVIEWAQKNQIEIEYVPNDITPRL